MLRLPEWMKYFFVLLYIATLTGLGLLLRESIDEFKLYNEMVQARRTTENTVREINTMHQSSWTTRAFRGITTSTKCAKSRSPGREQSWNGSQRSSARRKEPTPLHCCSWGQRERARDGGEAHHRAIVRISTAPADYLLQSAGEETPKYNELPRGQKANINNEFTAVVVQLKKQ